MKYLCKIFSLLLISASFNSILATDTLQVDQELSEEAMMAIYQKVLDSIETTLNYQTDKVLLDGDIAEIQVPAGYKYLNGKDSEMILTDIWGNPPSGPGNESLGMLIPENESPLQYTESSYSINITYSEDGYIDDKDAKEIDYDELLEAMQESSELENEQRQELGYPTIEIVGWASSPFYDAESKKLHWAQELKFEGQEEENTLNYNIRILGRKGYLNLNAIGEMHNLPDVKANIDGILNSVEFTEGNKYADFNPDIDNIAAYGIGGLIAGKMLAKAGILAKLGIVLAKFWKVALIGFIAFGAGVKRLFGVKKNPDDQVA